MKFQAFLFLILFESQYNSAFKCESSNNNDIALDLISDISTEIVDSNSNYLKQAVLCTNYDSWVKLTGSSYIWNVENIDSAGLEKVYFRKKFYIVGEPSSGTM